MKFFKKIKNYLRVLHQVNYIEKIAKKNDYKKDRLEAEIIRNVHSIEKGLSLENPRKFFGIIKIKEMLEYLDEYVLNESYLDSIVNMVLDSIDAYLQYHNEVIEDEKLKEIVMQYNSFLEKFHYKHRGFGGTIEIEYQKDEDYFKIFKQLVMKRHSVRDFSNESVPMETLRKAIEISLRAPSACNRQAVRVYVITSKNKENLNTWLSGVGGFAEAVDKYIIVTGKVSAYRTDELFQYAVSSSIFAGYLSLALQSVGIGACLIQRPLIRTKDWIDLSKKLGIPEDEQIVVMLGTGMLKSHYRVPVSNRLKYNEVVKEL